MALSTEAKPQAKPFSISFGSKSKPLVARSTAKKRNFASLVEDDSDGDQDAPTGKAQLVTAFDSATGGAIEADKKEEAGPLIIPAQKNLDWRAEARRRRGGDSLLPAEERARRAGRKDEEVQDQDEKKPVYGLLVADKTESNGDVPMTEPEIEVKPKTADEEAIEALLGNKESTMVIEADHENTRLQTRNSDTNAFRQDVATRPEPATLDDYAAVPTEGFGLALLRGMGYKPGDVVGRRKNAVPVVPRVPQRRANLLGIGAKEVPEGLEELGAWGKGAKKGSKIDRNYNPLVLKNRETGEVLTEAELKAKREQQSLVLEDVPEKKSKRRDYDDDRYESSRHSSSRRDRSRSRDRKDRRDRDRDRDRDDRSRRERSKDRSRRKDYDDEDYDSRKKSSRNDDFDRRDRHKEKSSRHDSKYDKHGDRYDDRNSKDRRRDDRR